MNKQSIASQKWQESKGLMIKGFKLKKDLVNQFEEACKARGTSQAAVISELMKNYINESKGAE